MKLGDVAEEQRRGKRRRRVGIDRGDADLAAADVAERRDERRHVEEIAQALAIGFEQHREGSVARGDGEQVRGALALLPERRAHAGAALRQEQRPRRVLAELRGEERRRPELAHDQRLHFVRVGQEQPRVGRLVDIRKPHHEPVVAPERLDVGAGLLADFRRDGHRPRRVDAPAPRRQDADAPVAELVAHALDDDRWSRRGRRAWRPSDRGGSASRFSAARASRSWSRVRRSMAAAGGRRRRSCISRPIASPSSSGRPARSPFQNGILPGSPGRRRDQHAIVRDLLDPPRRGAEHEGFADAALEDHLLVELADARRARARRRGGTRRRGRGREWSRRWRSATRFAPSRALIVPATRSQVTRGRSSGELVRGIAARQHVEHALEDRAAQLGERRRAPDRREQFVDVPLVHRRHRDDLLRDDVERVAGIARRFDGAVVHRPRDRRARHEIAAELREDDAFADGVGLVAAAADALQAARHRRRRLDLHDEIDGAHVDAELERRGRHQRARARRP